MINNKFCHSAAFTYKQYDNTLLTIYKKAMKEVALLKKKEKEKGKQRKLQAFLAVSEGIYILFTLRVLSCKSFCVHWGLEKVLLGLPFCLSLWIFVCSLLPIFLPTCHITSDIQAMLFMPLQDLRNVNRLPSWCKDILPFCCPWNILVLCSW